MDTLFIWIFAWVGLTLTALGAIYAVYRVARFLFIGTHLERNRRDLQDESKRFLVLDLSVKRKLTRKQQRALAYLLLTLPERKHCRAVIRWRNAFGRFCPYGN